MRGSFLFISKGRIELHGFFWKFAVICFSANSEYRISTDGYGVKMIATTKTTVTMTTTTTSNEMTTTTTTATNTTLTNKMKLKEFSVNHGKKKQTQQMRKMIKNRTQFRLCAFCKDPDICPEDMRITSESTIIHCILSYSNIVCRISMDWFFFLFVFCDGFFIRSFVCLFV